MAYFQGFPLHEKSRFLYHMRIYQLFLRIYSREHSIQITDTMKFQSRAYEWKQVQPAGSEHGYLFELQEFIFFLLTIYSIWIALEHMPKNKIGGPKFARLFKNWKQL